MRLHSQAQILEHGQALKQIGDLERAGDAQRGEAMRAQPADRLPGVGQTAGLRNVHAGKKVEQRGLAGAVGADQRVQPAMPQVDADIVHSREIAEFLAYVLGRKQHRVTLWRLCLQQAGRHLLRWIRFHARCHRGKRFGLLAPGGEQAFAQADQTRRRVQDECHEQQPEPEQPACGISGQDFAEQDVEGGTQWGPHEAARTADDRHCEDLAREIGVYRVRRGEQFAQVAHRNRALEVHCLSPRRGPAVAGVRE